MKHVQMLVHKSNICTVQNKTIPQPHFLVDYNFANSTDWATGIHANGLFLLSKTQKNFLVIANLSFEDTPEYSAQALTLFPRPQHVAYILRNIPVSTAAKP